jgi:hypothetical protein
MSKTEIYRLGEKIISQSRVDDGPLANEMPLEIALTCLMYWAAHQTDATEEYNVDFEGALARAHDLYCRIA